MVEVNWPFGFAVEKLVYQFGVRFYRDQIQIDIDESQQAFDATEKQQARLTNQNKDLNLRLGNNEQERVHLAGGVLPEAAAVTLALVPFQFLPQHFEVAARRRTD